MKTLRFIGMALMAVLMCVNFASCSNEEVTPDDPNQDKYITVGLDCVGEYLNVTDSPLSRAAGDAFQIQVYTVGEGAYAYGKFSSLDGVTIKLLQNKKYRFAVAITIGGSGYSEDFTYSSTDNFLYSKLIPCEYEGFYGELAEYAPEKGKDVSISTKRVSYGAHFIAENLNEGTLQIDVKKENMSPFPHTNLYSVILTPEISEVSDIYSFLNAREAWLGIETATGETDPETEEPIYEYKNYISEKILDISWIKSTDDIIPIGSYKVTFKRNVKTTIRIKVENPTYNNGIIVTKQEEEITDDENEYNIEGGEVVEIPVNSES